MFTRTGALPVCLVLSAGFAASVAIAQTNNTRYSNNSAVYVHIDEDTGEETTTVVAGNTAGTHLSTGDYNTFIGDLAGYSTTSGSLNVMIGNHAGTDNTTGRENTFIGHQAGRSVTTGQDNTFIGSQAGYANTDTDNTFIGTKAGYANTNGSNNTFIGEEAGLKTTEGDDNTFVGEDAGYNNTTGENNTFIGRSAGRTNEEGHGNTAVGSEAGYDLRNTASRNTMLGAGAGHDVGDGSGNTMLGANAGPNTEYGHFNTFVGMYAGYDNNRRNNNNSNKANRNTALGAVAGYSNRSGADNVWLGAFTNSGTAPYSYDPDWIADMHASYDSYWTPTNANTPGGNEDVYRTVVLGAFATANDDDSIAIGSYAEADDDKSIVIGNYADADGNEDIVIGYLADGANGADRSITIGTETVQTHDEAVTLGYKATSHNDYTVVLGNDNTISWDPHSNGSAALGQPVECVEDRNTAEITCDSGYRFNDVFANKLSAHGEEGTAAKIDLYADDGDDNADKWQIRAADNGSLSIASKATGSDRELFILDNTGNATLAGNLTLNSDARLKDNIQTIANAVSLITQIAGKTYHWKAGLGRDIETQYGFLAQNIENVLPALVTENTDGVKSVNYLGLMPVMVNAMKEQQTRIEKQDANIARLEALVAKQQTMIEALIEQQ